MEYATCHMPHLVCSWCQAHTGHRANSALTILYAPSLFIKEFYLKITRHSHEGSAHVRLFIQARG